MGDFWEGEVLKVAVVRRRKWMAASAFVWHVLKGLLPLLLQTASGLTWDLKIEERWFKGLDATVGVFTMVKVSTGEEAGSMVEEDGEGVVSNAIEWEFDNVDGPNGVVVVFVVKFTELIGVLKNAGPENFKKNQG